MQSKINLAEKLSTFSDYFSPRTIAQYNECDVMVVKAKGEFVWHSHEDTDDFFLVLKGSLDIELRDKTITLNPGEMYIVPKASNTAQLPAKRFTSCSSSPQARQTRAMRQLPPNAPSLRPTQPMAGFCV